MLKVKRIHIVASVLGEKREVVVELRPDDTAGLVLKRAGVNPRVCDLYFVEGQNRTRFRSRDRIFEALPDGAEVNVAYDFLAAQEAWLK